MESIAAYMPMDRRRALLEGRQLPERTWGTALFADISGFTPLTEALARELGPQRGAEELTRHLNRVYDALIDDLSRYHGSVIGFSGDAITCWLDDDDGARAVACALAMQADMQQFAAVSIPSGKTISLGMKVAIATGSVRRFLVGDLGIQRVEVLSGKTLEVLAEAEHQAQKGEIVLSPPTLVSLGSRVLVSEWRTDAHGEVYGLAVGLNIPVPEDPWIPIPDGALPEETVRGWLLSPVYERIQRGQGDFLAELRPAVGLFIRFLGIDFETDEAAGEKLDLFIRTAQRIVDRYEGFLIQLTVGDKGSYLYACFGAPCAHEDDALRAVSAAVDIRQQMQSLPFIKSLQFGISQGRMRVGAYGGSIQRTYGVLGDAVNLAARLMQAAAPGSLLVTQAVSRAAGDRFRWDAPIDLTVKGKSAPVRVCTLAGLAGGSTVQAQEAAYQLPMVGRQEELAAIAQKLEQSRLGYGQVLGISGEAGLGKSRLVSEAVRTAREHEIETCAGECQSYGVNISYLPWGAICRALFQLDSSQPLEQQVGDLQAHVAALLPDLLPRLPLLGSLLDLPIPENDLTRSLDPKIRKSSLEAMLADTIRARARLKPLLIVIEDLHWIDPLSLDLLDAVSRAIHNLPVAVILAYRPPDPQETQLSHLARLRYFTEIRLTSFSLEEAGRLIQLKLEKLFGPQLPVPPALIERIVGRSEGNPFYIEELLNYLKDLEIDPQDIHALERLELPSSLHSLILTRIDQLTENQKITLKIASVIGRIFKAAALWEAYHQLGSSEQVLADLQHLSQLDLTLLDPQPELTYFFKHIVTQEAAYQSLPFATRAVLHEQIAVYTEAKSADLTPPPLDLLAYHYSRSENTGKKREYLLKAGQAAQQEYANSAAIDYYEQVLPLVEGEHLAPILIQLGRVLELVGRWDRAVEVYTRALEQSTRLSQARVAAESQDALGELFRKRGRYDEALQWLGSARSAYQEQGDRSGLAVVLQHSGSLLAQRGSYPEARQFYDEGLAIQRELDNRRAIASLLSNLGIVARFLGDYSQARRLHQEGLELRRELGDRWAIAVSLNNMGNVALDQGDLNGARALLEEAVALQREVGDQYYIANAINNLGNVLRALGDYPTAFQLYKESLEINRQLGDRWIIAYMLEDIGCLAALENQPERALKLIGAASALREAIHAPLSLAEQMKLDALLAPAQQALSEKEQLNWMTVGKTTPLEEILDMALMRE
jgi:predicted ATPase/class 3 adenylate cyclase